MQMPPGVCLIALMLIGISAAGQMRQGYHSGSLAFHWNQTQLPAASSGPPALSTASRLSPFEFRSVQTRA